MANKLIVGQLYIIDEFPGGSKELARVTEVKGRLFKKYTAQIWGVNVNGYHEWPNGSVSSFTNVLKPADVTNARLTSVSDLLTEDVQQHTDGISRRNNNRKQPS